MGALATRAPLWAPGSLSVREAAARMQAHGVSSLLVEGDPPGIFTDRDLRRWVAEGRPLEAPVAQAASFPLLALPRTTPLLEAVAFMVERGIHHLPLLEGGQVVGMVTHTDLVRQEAQLPLLLLRRIEGLVLEGYAKEVAGLVQSLLEAGVGALEIGRLVAGLNDALVRRLLAEAERTLGPPPTPYAFLVLGSEGRREQALLTDQDNALLYAEEGHEPYFEALAERVVGGLLAAGFPPCPGGYMATRLRMSLEGFRKAMRGWIEAPEPEALLKAQTFLDLRQVGGELDLRPLEAELLAQAQKGVFLHHLARAALAFPPPPTPLGRLPSSLEPKRHGLFPIVLLARFYAVYTGSPERHTLDRLQAASRKGALSLEMAELLGEGFSLFFRLRLWAELLGQGALSPKALSPLERRRALEAFRAVRTAQGHLRLRFGLR